MKVRVPVYGTVGKSVLIDPNPGATIGKDLHMPDGTLASINSIAAAVAALLNAVNNATSTEPGSHHELSGLAEGDDHPQYTRAEDDESISGQWSFAAQPIVEGSVLREFVEDAIGSILVDTPSVLFDYDDYGSTAGKISAHVSPQYIIDLMKEQLVLSDLLDVFLDTAPQDGDALTYDGSSGLWHASPSSASLNLADLLDVEFTTSLQDGDVLVYNGTSGFWESGPQTGGGGSGSALNTAPETRGASFTGGTSVIVVPTNKVPINIREDCNITGIVVLTQGGTGSCVLDIWKRPYGTYPPVVANSICGAAKPTITADVKYTDGTLTGWTTALSAGDTLLVNLESCSTFTAVTLFLILSPVGAAALDGYTDERVRDVIAAALTNSSTISWNVSDAGDTISADALLSLDELVDAVIATPSDGEVLTYDGTTGMWVNAAPTGTPGSSAASSGVYQPTQTIVHGVDGVSDANARITWHLIGDYCFCTGQFRVSVGSGSTCALRFSLPIPSDTSTGSGYPLRLLGDGTVRYDGLAHDATLNYAAVMIGPNGSADEGLIGDWTAPTFIGGGGGHLADIWCTFMYKVA